MKKIKEIKLNIRTSKGIFGIVLQKWEGDKDYVVRVPKFHEIVTQGSNIKEAKEMAREAIELCIECKEEEITKHYGHNPDTKSKRSATITASSRL